MSHTSSPVRIQQIFQKDFRRSTSLGFTRPLGFNQAAFIFAVLWCAHPSFVKSAWAEEISAEDKAAARELATEGIKLAQAGNCDEAIPKLRRAEQLYHAPTILTWVGQCQIEVGRYVEGTETLNRVVRERIEEGAPDAYVKAQEKARELIAQAKPKIGKLTIEVTPTDIDGLEVTVDERPVSTALIGAPKPSDPGKHAVTVSAPGYTTQSGEVELSEGGQESLKFELKADPNYATTPMANAKTEDPVQEADKPTPNSLAWTTLGVGGALMAGGGVMGYLAIDKKKDLNCESDGRCAPSQEDTLSAARTNATVSTVLFGVGGAAAVTGVVLLLTSKSGKKSTSAAHRLEPQVGPGVVGLSGTF